MAFEILPKPVEEVQNERHGINPPGKNAVT
jgi:hypothetical protein